MIDQKIKERGIREVRAVQFNVRSEQDRLRKHRVRISVLIHAGIDRITQFVRFTVGECHNTSRRIQTCGCILQVDESHILQRDQRRKIKGVRTVIDFSRISADLIGIDVLSVPAETVFEKNYGHRIRPDTQIGDDRVRKIQHLDQVVAALQLPQRRAAVQRKRLQTVSLDVELCKLRHSGNVQLCQQIFSDFQDLQIGIRRCADRQLLQFTFAAAKLFQLGIVRYIQLAEAIVADVQHLQIREQRNARHVCDVACPKIKLGHILCVDQRAVFNRRGMFAQRVAEIFIREVRLIDRKRVAEIDGHIERRIIACAVRRLIGIGQLRGLGGKLDNARLLILPRSVGRRHACEFRYAEQSEIKGIRPVRLRRRVIVSDDLALRFEIDLVVFVRVLVRKDQFREPILPEIHPLEIRISGQIETVQSAAVPFAVAEHRLEIRMDAERQRLKISAAAEFHFAKRRKHADIQLGDVEIFACDLFQCGIGRVDPVSVRILQRQRRRVDDEHAKVRIARNVQRRQPRAVQNLQLLQVRICRKIEFGDIVVRMADERFQRGILRKLRRQSVRKLVVLAVQPFEVLEIPDALERRQSLITAVKLGHGARNRIDAVSAVIDDTFVQQPVKETGIEIVRIYRHRNAERHGHLHREGWIARIICIDELIRDPGSVICRNAGAGIQRPVRTVDRHLACVGNADRRQIEEIVSAVFGHQAVRGLIQFGIPQLDACGQVERGNVIVVDIQLFQCRYDRHIQLCQIVVVGADARQV